MDLLGFCCVYFGFGCLLILVWIDLVDFGRDGFWLLGLWYGWVWLLGLGGMARRERLSGSSKLKK